MVWYNHNGIWDTVWYNHSVPWYMYMGSCQMNMDMNIIYTTVQKFGISKNCFFCFFFKEKVVLFSKDALN